MKVADHNKGDTDVVFIVYGAMIHLGPQGEVLAVGDAESHLRDWPAALRPHLAEGSAVLAASADICPYLAASDVMVTDHSSAGFEYLLLDRPLVRIHAPALIALANIHQDYVQLLADVSESTSGVDDTVAAVERALANPSARCAMRRAVAEDLFHEPGTATARCAEALYEAVQLEPAGPLGSRLRATSGARAVHAHVRGGPERAALRVS